METSIHPADASDATALLELARSAYAELSSERGGIILLASAPLPEPDALEQALGAGATGGFLAAVDGAVIGAALVELRASALGAIGELRLLYVEPEAREVGLGEALLDAALEWSRERGALGLDVPALPGTRAAKSFLEAMGFRARLLVMHRALGEERTETS